MRRYTKDSVQTHTEGYHGTSYPAANIKVYKSMRDVKLPLCEGIIADADGSNQREVWTDPDYTHDWIDSHVSLPELDSWFWDCCSWNFEAIESEAHEVFGSHVSVYTAGRSGGWAIVKGLPDIEDWDAIMLSKWRKFERVSRLIADDVPYQIVMNIYSNTFQTWQQEQEENRESEDANTETLS